MTSVNLKLFIAISPTDSLSSGDGSSLVYRIAFGRVSRRSGFSHVVAKLHVATERKFRTFKLRWFDGQDYCRIYNSQDLVFAIGEVKKRRYPDQCIHLFVQPIKTFEDDSTGMVPCQQTANQIDSPMLATMDEDRPYTRAPPPSYHSRILSMRGSERDPTGVEDNHGHHRPISTKHASTVDLSSQLLHPHQPVEYNNHSADNIGSNYPQSIAIAPSSIRASERRRLGRGLFSRQATNRRR